MQRDKSLDVIKTIAILGTLMIHTTSVGFWGYEVGSADWLINNVWGAILRPAVPLFFMVSGCLFLNPDKDIKISNIYTKYICRILIALIFWATLYELFDVVRVGAPISAAVKKILVFKHHFHLYYLHIILLVYAMLPITRVFVASASKKQLEYALLLWVLLGIVYPFLRRFYPFNVLSGIPAQYEINLAYSGVGYGILGYYLKKYPLKVNSCLFYVFGIVLTYGITTVMSVITNKADANFLEATMPGVFLMAIGIFSFVVKREWKSDWWLRTSKASFCIYLIHDFFNIIFKKAGFTVLSFSPIISAPVIVLTNLLLSYLFYLLLSKIPIVKKYLI